MVLHIFPVSNTILYVDSGNHIWCMLRMADNGSYRLMGWREYADYGSVDNRGPCHWGIKILGHSTCMGHKSRRIESEAKG
jgi:hypothetical protein